MSVARALDEGQQKITVPETIDVVFEENNGKLVLVTGPLLIEGTILFKVNKNMSYLYFLNFLQIR